MTALSYLSEFYTQLNINRLSAHNLRKYKGIRWFVRVLGRFAGGDLKLGPGGGFNRGLNKKTPSPFGEGA
jgi:hypothetical protein